MILLHRSLKRSEDIMRSMKRFFEVNCKTIDGVIETFNNKIGQGFILKVMQSYNRDTDLVIWMFESLKDKNIQLGYSNHANVDEHNNWINKDLVNFKTYPIVKDIKREVVQNIFDNIKEYYGLNEEIEYTKEFKI